MNPPPEDASGTTPEGHEASATFRRFAAVAGLAMFALALPVIRVLVDAPEFFVAHRLTPWRTAAFVFVVTILVPLAIAAAVTALERVSDLFRLVTMGVLAIVACAGLLQPISGWSAVFLASAVIGGLALAAFELRRPAVRSVLASLVLLGPLLLVWGLGPSRVGAYARSGSDDSLGAARGARVKTPVIVLVFDEVSMVPMLDDHLEIDADRFPNFAALADTAHWYRQASSVSPQTSASVPALLSGVEPDLSKAPVSSQYPSNIFRLLRGMDAEAYEPITALCPKGVCGGSSAPTGSGSLGTLISDTGLVFRQSIASDAMREHMTSISHGWSGFGAASDDDDPDTAGGGYGTFPAQVDELGSLLAAPASKGSAPLRVGHFIAPHMPWITASDGTTYEAGDPPGMAAKDGTLVWSDDAGERAAGYQRYVLQVGALDRALGDARQQLEDEGLWDDALVVVTADHGVQFEPGGIRAVIQGGPEVTAVPLFIKEPHQKRGVIEKKAALTIDLLPTVLGELGLRSPVPLDGKDLFHDTIPSHRRDAFLIAEGQSATPDQSLGALRRAVVRRAAWIPTKGGWDAVYGMGVAQNPVGQRISALHPGAEAGTWVRAADETGRRVTFTLSGASHATDALAVCDGVVAGARSVEGGAEVEGELFVSPEHCKDPTAVELWTRDATGVHQAGGVR